MDLVSLGLQCEFQQANRELTNEEADSQTKGW